MTFDAPNARGAIVAYRSGDDAWHYLTGADLPIRFSAVDHYRVAIGCVSTNVAVAYSLAVYDLTQLTSDLHCAPAPTGTATLSGSISVPYDGGPSVVTVTWGRTTTNVQVTDASAEFEMTVPLGTHDLVAGLHRLGPGGIHYERATIVHDVAIGADVMVPVIDLTTPASAVTGGSGGPRPIVSTLLTAGGTRFQLSTTSYDTFSYLPESALGPDDRHELSYYVESGQAPRVYTIMLTPEALGDVTVPPRPTFDDGVVHWTVIPGATAYALRAAGRTVFISPEMFERSSTLTDAQPAPSSDWLFSHYFGWEAAVIMTSAPLDDAIRLVPHADTTIIGFR